MLWHSFNGSIKMKTNHTNVTKDLYIEDYLTRSMYNSDAEIIEQNH